MSNLENLRVKREIVQNNIQVIRSKIQKQKDRIYGENMVLHDLETELKKYYDEDIRLADELFKLTH